jgi:hypothetical protein
VATGIERKDGRVAQNLLLKENFGVAGWQRYPIQKILSGGWQGGRLILLRTFFTMRVAGGIECTKRKCPFLEPFFISISFLLAGVCCGIFFHS